MWLRLPDWIAQPQVTDTLNKERRKFKQKIRIFFSSTVHMFKSNISVSVFSREQVTLIS